VISRRTAFHSFCTVCLFAHFRCVQLVSSRYACLLAVSPAPLSFARRCRASFALCALRQRAHSEWHNVNKITGRRAGGDVSVDRQARESISSARNQQSSHHKMGKTASDGRWFEQHVKDNVDGNIENMAATPMALAAISGSFSRNYVVSHHGLARACLLPDCGTGRRCWWACVLADDERGEGSSARRVSTSIEQTSDQQAASSWRKQRGAADGSSVPYRWSNLSREQLRG